MMKKPTGWGAGGRVVLLVVEVARVELASKYVKYSATTGLVGCCTLRSAGSRRPALHDFPFGTLWQGTGTTRGAFHVASICAMAQTSAGSCRV